MSRNLTYDIARVLAIILVIFNHANEGVFPLLKMSNWSNGNTIAAYLFESIGRNGVPLFFFLTGALLLPRKFDNAYILKFWKNNWGRLFIAWEMWICCYQWFEWAVLHESFNLSMFIKKLFLMQAIGLPHEWYIPAILGIYIFLPFLSRAISLLDKKILLIPLAIVFTIFFIFPSITYFFPNHPIFSLLDMSLSGGEYSFYIVIGYILGMHSSKVESLATSKKLLIAACYIILVTLTTLLQLFLSHSAKPIHLGYEFILIPFSSVALWILIHWIGNKINKNSSIAKFIIVSSKISFGVYCVHIPVLFTISPLFASIPHTYGYVTQVFCFFFSTTILSFSICYFLYKVPFLSHLILLKK